MADSVFDILAGQDLTNSLDGVNILPEPITPSKLETLQDTSALKAQELANRATTKTTRGTQIAADIRGIDQSKYKAATLDEVVDGDTLKIRGEEDSLRFGGSPAYRPKDPMGWIDTPETYHGAFSEKPKEVARVAKQQTALGLKSPTEVYQAGELSKLDAMYTLMGRPKDAQGKEWTPGPITYDPTKVGSIQLGSKQNPLGLGIREYHTDAHTKDGRGLGYFEDKSGTQNLNARIAEQGMLSVPDTVMPQAGAHLGLEGDYAARVAQLQARMPKAQERVVHANADVKSVGDVVERMKVALKERESGGGDYRAVNKDTGFLGAYQVGAAVLADLGYVKHGLKNKDLWNPNAWTGKDGIGSKGQFLQNARVQDKIADQHIVNLYNQVKDRAKNTSEVGGYIMAAHLLGVEGSKNLAKQDLNKTSGHDYFEYGKKAMGTGNAALKYKQMLTRDKREDTGIWNGVKAVLAGITNVGATVLDAPKSTYEALGGDYMEKGSAFAKEHPVYAKNAKDMMDFFHTASNDVRAFNSDILQYNPALQDEFTQDLGKAFTDKKYVTGLFGAVLNNPLGALEFAASSYGFTKAMGAKGLTGTPAVLASFSDNASQAQEIYRKEHGAPAQGEQLAALLGLSALGTALDTAASKWLLGGNKGEQLSSAIGESVTKMLEKVPNSVARAALGGSYKLARTMAVEGSQEGLTEASIIAGGTQDADKFGKDEYMQQLYTATAGGAVSGPGMHAVDAGVNVAEGVAKNILSKDVRDKMIEAIKERRGKVGVAPAPTQASNDYVKEASAYTADITTPRASTDEVVSDIAKYEEDITKLQSAGKLDAAVSKAYEDKKAVVMQEFSGIDVSSDEHIPMFGSSRKALNYLSLVLDNKTLDADTEAKVDKIAAKNGVSVEQLKLIKDMASVEQEAVEGKRGYNTYFRKLNSLMEEPEVNAKKIRDTASKMNKYRAAELGYANVLEGLINQAKTHMATNKEADKINAVNAKVKQFPGTIPADEFRDKPYTITVSASEAGIAAMQKVLDKKRQNIAGLEAGLKLTGTELHDLGIDTEIFTGKGVVIPQADDTKTKGLRKADEDTYNKHGVTKVILGKTATKKWAEYDKLAHNKDLINTGKYTKDDVVVINALTYGNKGAGKELIAEIKKAKKAGATILIDADMKGEARKFIIRQLTQDFGSGVKYIHTTANGNVFKPVEVASKENKEVKETVAKSEAEKATKAKANGALVLKWAELYETHEGNEEAIVKDMKVAEEMGKAYENFTGSETKTAEERMLEFAKNSFNNQVAELSTGYYKAMVSNEGVLSSADEEAINKKTDIKSARIRAAAMKIAEAKMVKAGKYKDLLAKWKETGEDRITQEDMLANLLETNGIDEKEVLNDAVKSSSSEYVKEENAAKVYVGGTPATSRKLSNGGKQLLVQLKDVIEVARTTALNTLRVELMGPQMGALVDEAVFHMVGDKGDGFLELNYSKEHKGHTFSKYANALIDSPARGLVITDVNGKDTLNKNVVAALTVALHEHITMSSHMMSDKFKSRQDIANAHGIEEFKVTNKTVAALAPMGMLRKTLANDIGSSVATLLGLKAKEGDIDREQFDRLKADLGNMAIMMGVDMKILNFGEMPLKEYLDALGKEEFIAATNEGATVGFIQIAKENFGTEDNKGMVEEYKGTYEMIKEILPDAVTTRREPSFQPVNKKAMATKAGKIAKDKSGFVPATEASKALENLMKQAWKVDTGLMDYVLANKELIKEALGYQEIDEDNPPMDMTYEERETKVAQNRDIEKSIDELAVLKERMDGEDNPELFFEWFYTKNGRYMMDSNTINPQTDKQLHRFIVAPKEHVNDYTIEGEGVDIKFKRNNEDITKRMHYALAQALGIAVDKKSTESFMTSMQQLVADVKGNKLSIGTISHKTVDGVEEKVITQIDGPQTVDAARDALLKHGELDINGVKVEIEHLAHALQAFDVLKQLQAGDKVTSAITAEFDAVTSGFGLKITQMPIIKRTVRYALKVGIIPKALQDPELLAEYLKTDKDLLKDHGDLLELLKDPTNLSMNDVLAKTIKDSYQTLATEIVGIDEKFVTKQITVVKDRESKAIPVKDVTRGVESALKGTTSVWKELDSMLPKYTEELGVTSALRNLFKSPFMTFNYSASIKSIRAALAGNMAADVMHVLLTDKGDELAKRIIRDLVGVNKMTVAQLRKMIVEQDPGMIRVGTQGLQSYLQTLINLSYGAKVEEVLNTEFGEFLQVQDAVNMSFKAMFHAYNVELQEELDKLMTDKGFVSKADEKAINEKLLKKFPAIKGPLSEDEGTDKVGIYDMKTSSPEDSAGVQTHMNPKWAKPNGLKANQATLKVWHKVKQFEAAVSAGSVVPIHYIDGAVMGRLLNVFASKYGSSMITAIHDAIMPPLHLANEGVKEYNKQLVDTTSDYNVIDELMTALTNTQKVVEADADKFKAKVNTRTDDGYQDVAISEMVNIAMDKLGVQHKKVKDGIKQYKELMSHGAYVMHMAGMSEGVYDYKGHESAKEVVKETKQPKAETKSKDDIISEIETIITNNSTGKIDKTFFDKLLDQAIKKCNA
ncbi:MAG: hypothetical protein ACYDD5_00710 [Sulfuricurvum sp.]